MKKEKTGLMADLDRLHSHRHPRHRHPVGRRRDEPVGHRPVHCRFVVLGRAPARWRTRIRPRRRSRASGGVSGKPPDRDGDRRLPRGCRRQGLDRRHGAAGRQARRPARRVLDGLGICLETMWDLAQEMLGRGPAVPYERCVVGSTGKPPSRRIRRAKRERVRELLGRAGLSPRSRPRSSWPPSTPGGATGSCRARRFRCWRTPSSRSSRRAWRGISLPHLPADLSGVPRANMTFLPIENAWFSGSMNYLGRARNADGSPRVRSDLRAQRLARDLGARVRAAGQRTRSCRATSRRSRYRRGCTSGAASGFEATVLTMNTRPADALRGHRQQRRS